MDHLIDWLPEHIPPGDETAIVHGDYRLDNLIFHPTEPRILAMLDWELSTLGHPLADFSYHCMSWHIPPEQFRGIAGLDLAALGHSLGGRVRRRLLRAHRPRPASTHWDFYLAYNMFRLAGDPAGHHEARARRAPRRARRRSTPASARGRWPSWAGSTRKKHRSQKLTKGNTWISPIPKGARTLAETRLQAVFMDEHIYPNEHRFHARSRGEHAQGQPLDADRVIEELKPKARAAGLWNLFLPRSAARRRGLDEPRVRAAVRDHGPRAVGARSLQLLGARHRQHGNDRALRHATSRRRNGSSRCSTARSARPSR